MEDESMECENIVEKDEEVEDDPGAFKNFGISDFVAKKLNGELVNVMLVMDIA